MMGWTLWVLFVALGLVTYALRVAFFLKPGSVDAPITEQPGASPSPTFLRALPAAVLAALITPALTQGSPGSPFPPTQWLVGLVGLVVAVGSARHPAWRRYTVLLTVFCGLVTMWLRSLRGL